MRSRHPQGPYYDAAGNPMADVAGRPGTLFDDRSIEPFGVKLVGNHQFIPLPGEKPYTSRGYVSPGHNSAYYDPVEDKYFLFFHTRFAHRGEYHEVRVHQFFINEDGWPVVAPYRYAGERLEPYSVDELIGDYKLVIHTKEITATMQRSVPITLSPDNSITGSLSGEWYQTGDFSVWISLNGEEYKGVFLRQWNNDQQSWVMTFTALSQSGVSIWASKMVLP